MKLSIYKQWFLLGVSIAFIVAVVILLPGIAEAHGGDMTAEEEMNENLVMAIGAIVLIAVSALLWFKFFRKK